VKASSSRAVLGTLAVVLGLGSPAAGRGRRRDRIPALRHDAPVASAGDPKAVVVLGSDAAGWDDTMSALASALAQDGTLVLGFDSRHFLAALGRENDPCYYPAGDLEGLSHYMELQANVPAYHEPVVVGVGAGAALLYGMVVQAPAHMVRALVTVGFTPTLSLSRGLCRGHGLSAVHANGVVQLGPAAQMPVPWRALPVGSPAEQQASAAFGGARWRGRDTARPDAG